jgi:hypothetical protein
MQANRRGLLGGIAAVIAAAGGASRLRAQGQAPPQPSLENGPVWDWREHAPQREATRLREDSAGIEPSARENERESAEVDSLYRDLTGQNANAPPRAQPAPSSRTMPR